MATAYRGTKEEELALSTFIVLSRAARAVSERLQGTFAEAGLTVGQFAVLELLLHKGPQRAQEIARLILCSGGNLTLVLDNLEKRKLIKRTREKEDRRCITVDLTPNGRELISGIFPAHAQKVAEQFAVLTPEECQTLAVLCKKVGKGGE